MAKLQPVLLSGGSGTRLWPLSREAYPKQFLPLAEADTMLQATWKRVHALADAAPIVVAGEDHRFLVAEQLRQIGAPTPAIILEPLGRNTAPAIAAAALQAMAQGEDPLLLVLPSDHVVRDAGAFAAAIELAKPVAAAGQLVTFGIVPNAPETGFGYIQAAAGEGVRKVLRFVEKRQSFGRRFACTAPFLWRRSAGCAAVFCCFCLPCLPPGPRPSRRRGESAALPRRTYIAAAVGGVCICRKAGGRKLLYKNKFPDIDKNKAQY